MLTFEKENATNKLSSWHRQLWIIGKEASDVPEGRLSMKSVTGVWFPFNGEEVNGTTKRSIQQRIDRTEWIPRESGANTCVLVSQARRTLGVYFIPDDNNKDMLRVLKEKASLWLDQMRSGHLGCDESWRALVTTIMKTVEYPLLSSTFQRSELKEVTTVVLLFQSWGSHFYLYQKLNLYLKTYSIPRRTP